MAVNGIFDLAIVLLLSAIPFIESRGAMFYGFSVGITDAWVYAACVLVNVLQAYAYPPILGRLLGWNGRALKKAAEGIRATIKGKVSPSFFLVAIPAFGNGINTFSSSLISVWLGLKGCQKYVAGGAILRGALTFAILSGTTFLSPDLAQAALKLLLCAYVLHLAYSARGWLLKKFGLERRKKACLKYVAAGAALLALCALLLAWGELAGALSQFFSLIYYSSSPGKLILFLAFVAAALFARGYWQPGKKANASADRSALYYFLFPLVAVCLVALGIAWYFIVQTNAQLQEFGMNERIQYGFFTLDEKAYLGFSRTSFREDHNHVLKAAAFLPAIIAFPQLDQAYAMSINFYYRLPFLLLALLFGAIVLLAIAALANCCRFGGFRLAACTVFSYLALAGAIDAGLLSPFTVAAIAGLAIVSLDGNRRLSATVLLAVFSLFADWSLSGYALEAPLAALRAAAMAAGFFLAYKDRRAPAAAAFALASAAGWPDLVALAAPAAAFLSTALIGTELAYAIVALSALVFSIHIETWTLPIGLSHAAMPVCISAAALVSGRRKDIAVLAAILAFSLFAALPGYYAEYRNNNFDRDMMGYDAAVFLDGRGGLAEWPEGMGLAAGASEPGSPIVVLRSLNGTLRSLLNTKLPELYRHELVCPQSSSARETKSYIVADARCSEVFGEPAGKRVLSAAATNVSMRFHDGSAGKCLVEMGSAGRFSKCRYLAFWAFQNSSLLRNATGVFANPLQQAHAGE